MKKATKIYKRYQPLHGVGNHILKSFMDLCIVRKQEDNAEQQTQKGQSENTWYGWALSQNDNCHGVVSLT